MLLQFSPGLLRGRWRTLRTWSARRTPPGTASRPLWRWGRRPPPRSEEPSPVRTFSWICVWVCFGSRRHRVPRPGTQKKTSCWMCALNTTCVCVCAPPQAASPTAYGTASTRSSSSPQLHGRWWSSQAFTPSSTAPPTGIDLSSHGRRAWFASHFKWVLCFHVRNKSNPSPPPPPHTPVGPSWSEHVHLRLLLSRSQVNHTLPAVTTGVPQEKINA